jgi:hypothetical protein
VLVCDNPNIQTILTLTRLDRIFDTFESRSQAEAAIEALREARAADSAA